MKEHTKEIIRGLFDDDSFNELGRDVKMLTTGYGTINGQLVFVYLQDSDEPQGGFSAIQGEQICQLLKLASDSGAPVIGLLDSPGAVINQGLDVLKAYGELYQAHLKAKKSVPIMIGIVGQAVGADALLPAMGDFVFCLRGATKWHVNTVTAINQLNGEQVDSNRLGGADIHSQTTGQAHFIYEDMEQLLQAMRWMVNFLPASTKQRHQMDPSQLEVELDQAGNNGAMLQDLIGDNLPGDYNMGEYLALIFGQDNFLSIKDHFGHGMIAGLANVMGVTVGVVANQPQYQDGRIDVNGLGKATQLVEFCSRYQLPVISFVDTQGFLAQSNQEYLGLTQTATDYLATYACHGAAKLTIVMGSAVGTSFNLMGSKAMGADLVYAWPTARVGLLNPEATNFLVNYQVIQDSQEPGSKWQDTLTTTRQEVGTAKAALDRGLIDGMIDPQETYSAIYNFLNLLQLKRGHNPAGLGGM